MSDFGFSRDCNDTISTTEGPTGRNPKYCVPEVAEHAPRNYTSDFWSLGYVFVEMLTVLKGFGLDQLGTFISENGTGLSSYHANPEGVVTWLEVALELHQ